MATAVDQDLQAQIHDEASRLLVEQIRLAFWNILIVAGVLTIGDMAFGGLDQLRLHAVNLAAVAVLLLGLHTLRLPDVRRRAVVVALITVAAVCFCTAAAGILRHDATTAPLLAVILTMAIGAVFAWGIGPQMVVVAIAAATITWNVYTVNGRFGTLGHTTILTAVVAALSSVWMAHRRLRFRIELAQDNLARQRDAARRAGEERFAALVEKSSDIIVIEGPDAVPRYASPAVERVLGYTPEEFVGKNSLQYVHPDDLPAIQALYQSVVERPGDSVSAQYRVRHASGAWVYVEAVATNLLQHPQVGGIVVHARDITDRRRIAQEKDVLLEVARDISGMLDLSEMLGRVQRRLALLLPCDRVATFMWDPAREVFRMVSHHGLPDGVMTEAMALEFHAGEAVTKEMGEQRSLVINDIHQQQWFPVDLLRRFEIGALVSIPLVVHGRLVGGLGASRIATNQPFTADQVRLFEGIARHVAVAIGTVELYEAQQADATVSSALARVGQDLIASLNAPDLLERLGRLTTEVLGCDVSHTYMLERGTQAYTVVAGYGDTPEQWHALAALQMPPDFIAPMLTRFEREDVVQLQVAHSRDFISTALRRFYGMKLGAYIPLRRGGEIFGIQAALFRRQESPLSREQERIARGIGQLASMALENARLLSELERANRFNSDFVASMSHELRTPLNVVIGYHDLLLDGTFDALTVAQADTIMRADRSARELLDLVNVTLDLSRFEAKPTALQLQDVAIPTLLEEIAREAQARLADSAVAFRWAVAPELSPLHTDALKLKMVLKNLVENAIKFTPHGSISVAARAADDGIEFAVADTGIGIAADAHGAIFEPFRQVANAETQRHGGVGLGLYIVRRLVEMVGGRVALESTLGVGSTFRVWIPSSIGRSANQSGETHAAQA